MRAVVVLAAVTGGRRGELVAIRRSGVNWSKRLVTIDSAVTSSGKVKATKTYRSRTFHIDGATTAMLKRHCNQMDADAKAAGMRLDPDPYLFSAVPDYSAPLAPDLLTKQVAVLKGYLGIESKDPGVVDLENEALRLRRSAPSPRLAGRPRPDPQGGMSFREIGEVLGRSERWASLAVASAQRREAANAGGRAQLNFDGSILGLRKFTSSELLDAGFNVSVVAERQGHGPQVLTRHYSKLRASSDQRAAEHLGRVIHGD